MNCNKTETFFAEWKRMCEYTNETCPLIREGISVGCTFCEEKVLRNSDKAIKIVQEWSDKHPVRTRLSVLKEQYPNFIMRGEGIPTTCAGLLYGWVSENGCDNDCTKCWNTPIEGVQ